MLDNLPNPIQGAAHLTGKAGIIRRFVKRSGVLSALTARGVLSYARSAVAVGRGPHVPIYVHAANKPDKVALIGASQSEPGGMRRLTYRDLCREVNQVAHGLGRLGVRPGDRVAIMMPNCPEYVILQVALLTCGASAVHVGYRLKAREIAHVLENSQPVVVVVHHDYQDEMNAARAQSGGPDDGQVVVAHAHGRAIVVGQGYDHMIAEHDGRHPPKWSDAREGTSIIYTSGTTGNPKGAKRNLHGTDKTAALQLMTRVGMCHDDRHLVVCPLYHSAAPAFASLMLMLGATAVVLERFDAETVLSVIERERITCAFMVPTMLRRLTEVPEAIRARHDTSSLRWILSGAAALSTDTAVRFQEVFGPVLYNFYGSTETGMVTLAEPPDHGSHPGTIGRLLFGNEIRFLDDQGQEVAAGEVGELWVRNGMLVSGYHRNRQATDKAMRDGFFSVGDMGRVDADGYYYLASRKRDMVISGGVNIYPREIENFLHDHPDIVEAAIIGVPDAEWGESLEAFVVLRPGSDLDEAGIIHMCRENLAGYKRPKRVHFIDELPRNPTGKVLKRTLREWRQAMPSGG